LSKCRQIIDNWPTVNNQAHAMENISSVSVSGLYKLNTPKRLITTKKGTSFVVNIWLRTTYWTDVECPNRIQLQ